MIWVPGNHELLSQRSDPPELRGERRYRHLVELCRKLGVITPEDPYPIWDGPGGPARVVPLFLLYDYSFGSNVGATREEALRRAHEAGVVCVDEFLLDPDPYPSRQAWCEARVRETESRLAEVEPALPTVLVNHFPLLGRADPGASPPRVRPVVRDRRSPPTGTAASGPGPSSTGTSISPARPGTTACASRRSRWATRGSGGAGAARLAVRAASCRKRRMLERDPARERRRRAKSAATSPMRRSSRRRRRSIGRAVEKRRREFRTARACARARAGAARRRAAGDPERAARGAAVAGRDRRQHHPLRRLPRRGARARRRIWRRSASTPSSTRRCRTGCSATSPCPRSAERLRGAGARGARA